MGVMGSGIIQLALPSGCQVVCKDRTKEALDKSLKKIKKNLLKSMNVKDKDRLLTNLKPTIDLNDLADMDLVIETIIEDKGVKKQLFIELDKICSKKTILATNTSSLSVTELASVTSNPSRVVGMHFFNPVLKMQLVEVVGGEKISDKTVQFAIEIVKILNKMPVIVKDTPGFVVNKLLVLIINEAFWMAYNKFTSPEDIDKAMKLGANHPIGPLSLSDLIGLDECLIILNNLYSRTKNRSYKPCPLLVDLVKMGYL